MVLRNSIDSVQHRVHPATLDSGWTINDTNIPLQLRYGDGSYGVNGSIAVASFAMGSFNIAEQGMLHWCLVIN